MNCLWKTPLRKDWFAWCLFLKQPGDSTCTLQPCFAPDANWHQAHPHGMLEISQNIELSKMTRSSSHRLSPQRECFWMVLRTSTPFGSLARNSRIQISGITEMASKFLCLRSKNTSWKYLTSEQQDCFDPFRDDVKINVLALESAWIIHVLDQGQSRQVCGRPQRTVSPVGVTPACFFFCSLLRCWCFNRLGRLRFSLTWQIFRKCGVIQLDCNTKQGNEVSYTLTWTSGAFCGFLSFAFSEVLASLSLPFDSSVTSQSVIWQTMSGPFQATFVSSRNATPTFCLCICFHRKNMTSKIWTSRWFLDVAKLWAVCFETKSLRSFHCTQF